MTLGNGIGLAGICVSVLLAVFGADLRAAMAGQQPKRNSRKSWHDAEEAARVCAQMQSSFADAFKTAAVNRAVRVEALAIALLPVQLIAVGTVLYLGFAVFMGYLFYISWIGDENTNWFSLCVAIGYGIAGAWVGWITRRREATNQKITARIDEAIADADPRVATDPRCLALDVQRELHQRKEQKARKTINRHWLTNSKLSGANYLLKKQVKRLESKLEKREIEVTQKEIEP